jgi:hypothetical protein
MQPPWFGALGRELRWRRRRRRGDGSRRDPERKEWGDEIPGGLDGLV